MSNFVWCVLDLWTDDGDVRGIVHCHKTKESAEHFVSENLKHDPFADFRIQKCVVYDCFEKDGEESK